MADAESERAFFRNAALSTIVPESSKAKLPEALDEIAEAWTENDSSLLSIKQREHLFYDEQLTVYVVLRITSNAEESLKDILARLDVKLDVHAVDHSEPQADYQQWEDHEGPEQDLIFSNHVKDDGDPFIAVSAGGELSDRNKPTIFAIWNIEATLHRPRMRFPNVAVTFTASASLTKAKHTDQITFDVGNLPSSGPASSNIFDGLKAIPGLKDRVPFLPASRIQSVLPGPQLDSETLRIRHKPVRRIPISPAVSARIRCSRMSTNTPHPTLIASLDFEITPFATFDVLLNHANVTLASDGQIDLLGPFKMPISCKPRSIITFLYKVQPKVNMVESPLPLPTGRPNSAGILDIVLDSNLQISRDCKPAIKMRWRSNVDFVTSPSARLGPPSQPPQRSSRLDSFPLSPPASSVTSTSPRPITPPRSGRVDPLKSSTITTSPFSSTNLTISFTAPSTVFLGHIFTYTILVTNHSSRPLKLAIVPIPRRPPGSTLPPRRHAPRPSTSSAVDRRHSTRTNPIPSTDIAPAVTDENIVYALQKASINIHTDTDLVPISTDVKVGPLASGACHEVQLKMLALTVGVLRLEAVRFVDLVKDQDGGGTGASRVVDVRAELLPEVVVVRGPGPGPKDEPSG